MSALAPSVPAATERRRESVDHTKAVGKAKLERLLSRRDLPLREKTLYRMLYETAARAAEILSLNVEGLDLENRRARLTLQGRRYRMGLLGRRNCPPPAPPAPSAGRPPRWCRSHTRACLLGRTASSSRPAPRARAHLPAHRHQLIMAKTRHKNPRTAMRYTRPGGEAVAEITSILGPRPRGP